MTTPLIGQDPELRRQGRGIAAATGLDSSAGPIDRPVTCVFCREPIEISCFKTGERQTRTASCPNCGLLISVAAPVWALWSRQNVTSEGTLGLAEQLRARRVATAARLALEDVVPSTGLGVSTATPSSSRPDRGRRPSW